MAPQYYQWRVAVALRRLAAEAERCVGAVEEVARVDLHRRLVRAHLQGDRRHVRHAAARPPAVEDPRVVVASTGRDDAAVDVGPHALGLQEGEKRVRRLAHVPFAARRDQVVVGRATHLERARRGGQREHVLEHGAHVAHVCVQVEVRVVCHRQHRRRVARCAVLDAPRAVVREGVGDVDRHRAGEAHLAVSGVVLPGDRAGSACDRGPDSAIPAYHAAMQRVEVLLIAREGVLYPVEHEAAVSDAVRDAADGGAKVGMLRVAAVLRRVIPAEQHVALRARAVLHDKMSHRSAVGNHRGLDGALCVRQVHGAEG
eukprot:3720200-Prymnesium_polylepis.1